MTLAECVHVLESAALQQPAVRTVVGGDVFRLNAMPSVRYGVFAWTQDRHTDALDGGVVRYRLTLFYVDRLSPGGRNELEVQSTGVSVLGNIIRAAAEEGVEAEQWDCQPFTQRFMDECAGVFATVEFTAPGGGGCAEEYGGETPGGEYFRFKKKTVWLSRTNPSGENTVESNTDWRIG